MGILLPSSLESGIFGPSFSYKGPSDVGCRYQDLDLIPEEKSYDVFRTPRNEEHLCGVLRIQNLGDRCPYGGFESKCS